MLSESHLFLTYFSMGMICAFGMCFLFLKTPTSADLRNYRFARFIMAAAYIILACAYIIFAAVSELEIEAVSEFSSKLTRVVTLTTAVFQAFLFTYTLISLIDLSFVTRHKIILELTPIVLLSGLLIVALNHNFLHEHFNIVFHVYLAYYFSLLLRYTFIFLKQYRRYIRRVDNYFSEEEEHRLRWIFYTFFAALAIGVAAFLLPFFHSKLYFTLFVLSFMCFYIYFGIQFINYAFLFGEIKPLLEEQPAPSSAQEPPIAENEIAGNIRTWIAEKKFMEKGLTIDHLSKEFLTNRTYVSKHINSVYHRSFNEWINDLRIEEAKKLFSENPKISIGNVSEQVGYANSSHFTREFSKREGVSPREWNARREELKVEKFIAHHNP